MRLEHRFEVPAAVDDVWQALLDPERVAPCMPGATLTGVDGNTFTGKVRVKLGAMSLQYAGSGEFVDTDPAAHSLVIKAAGKDARGASTASAESTVTLTEHDGVTHGMVVSEVKVTGRPAQFGRGLISEVAGRILAQFAENLAAELAPAQPDATAQPVQPPDAIDLLEVAGAPVLKRLAPVLALIAVVLAVAAIVRARRRQVISG